MPKIIDSIISHRLRKYHHIEKLKIGQSVIYERSDFPYVNNMFHSVRNAAYMCRKRLGFVLEVHKHEDENGSVSVSRLG